MLKPAHIVRPAVYRTAPWQNQTATVGFAGQRIAEHWANTSYKCSQVGKTYIFHENSPPRQNKLLPVQQKESNLCITFKALHVPQLSPPLKRRTNVDSFQLSSLSRAFFVAAFSASPPISTGYGSAALRLRSAFALPSTVHQSPPVAVCRGVPTIIT